MDYYLYLLGSVFCGIWNEWTGAIGLYALQRNCATKSYEIAWAIILISAYLIFEKWKK